MSMFFHSVYTNLQQCQGVLPRLRRVWQAKGNRLLARDVTILDTHRQTQRPRRLRKTQRTNAPAQHTYSLV